MPGTGLTAFKVDSEYAIVGLHAASLWILHKKRSAFGKQIYELLRLSIVLMALMEVCFTFYKSDAMSDFFNELGHLIKIFSFYLLCKAIVIGSLRDPLLLMSRELRNSEERLRADAKRLADILDLQRDIASSNLNYSALLQFILERMTHLVACDGACLEICDNEEMVYEAATGLAAGSAGLRLKAAASLSGLSMATNQLLRADDTENDPRVDRDACRRIGLRSMILLPLRYGERSFGVLKLMSKRVSAFTADAEHTLRLMGQFLGVTIARKRAEEALRESEARLQAVLDGSPDPIFVKDREGRQVMANPATYAVIGKPAEACLGKTDEQFLDNPADGRAIMANDRRIMASGQAETVEEMISTPSGTRYYVSNKAPCRDAAGDVIGLIGTARDVTERKQAEQALQANAKRLAGVLDAQQEIASSDLDYQGLRQLILERMTRLVAADGACLELAEGDELVYEAASGLAAGFTGLRVKKGASLSGLCMTSNQMWRSDDTETDPRVDREACRRIGLRSMIVMPLRYDERTFGVLKLMSARVAAFTAELGAGVTVDGRVPGHDDCAPAGPRGAPGKRGTVARHRRYRRGRDHRHR